MFYETINMDSGMDVDADILFFWWDKLWRKIWSLTRNCISAL